MNIKGMAAEAELRLQLAEVSNAVRELHRTLVASAQAVFEQENGPVNGPGALLQLLLHDPLFTWLRPISGLIAELDELVDDADTPVDISTLARVRGNVERWISESEGAGANEFTPRYLALLQTDVDVLGAHAAVRKRLAILPRSGATARK